MSGSLDRSERILAGFSGVGQAGAAIGIKVDEVGAEPRRAAALQKVCLLPQDIQNQLRDGTLKLSDNMYFSILSATALSTLDMINKSTPASDGVTNFENAELNNWTFVQELRLLKKDGGTGRYFAALDANLLNGIFTIKANSKEIISDMCMEAFANSVAGYEVNKAWGSYILKNPFWIAPKVKNEFYIKLAAAVTGDYKLIYVVNELKSW